MDIPLAGTGILQADRAYVCMYVRTPCCAKRTNVLRAAVGLVGAPDTDSTGWIFPRRNEEGDLEKGLGTRPDVRWDSISKNLRGSN